MIQNIVQSRKTLRLFAGHLRQAGIIDDAVICNPSYHNMVHSFTATLRVLATIDDIETHCQKFIDALRELGGVGATQCADILREEWRTAAKDNGYNHFMDMQGTVRRRTKLIASPTLYLAVEQSHSHTRG